MNIKLALVLFSMAILSCSSKAPQKNIELTPLKGFELIPTGRACEQSYPLTDKESVLQICKSQIYEFDLLRKKERRITYQDGQIFQVMPEQSGEFLYVSNTDEIKEHFLTPDLDPSTTAGDIYKSAKSHTEIHRLTRRHGFDGFIIKSKLPNQIYYLQAEHQKSRLMTFNLINQKSNQIFEISEKVIQITGFSEQNIFYFITQTGDQYRLEKRTNNTQTTEKSFSKDTQNPLLFSSQKYGLIGTLEPDAKSKKTRIEIKSMNSDCRWVLEEIDAVPTHVYLTDEGTLTLWLTANGILYKKILNETDSACLSQQKAAK